MDRDEIERHDFPPAAQGYDPESVHAHLRSVADRLDDEAGARLVALKMALEGTSREVAARFPAAHYAVADLGGLLDDVDASAGR
jgi:DivIVA domain-containing protein